MHTSQWSNVALSLFDVGPTQQALSMAAAFIFSGLDQIIQNCAFHPSQFHLTENLQIRLKGNKKRLLSHVDFQRLC